MRPVVELMYLDFIGVCLAPELEREWLPGRDDIVAAVRRLAAV